MNELERAVLAAAEERFVAYMAERHYKSEDHVLKAMSRQETPANKLIRAVAEWRKAKTQEAKS